MLFELLLIDGILHVLIGMEASRPGSLIMDTKYSMESYVVVEHVEILRIELEEHGERSNVLDIS